MKTIVRKITKLHSGINC